jgi:hypothetical protein
LRVASFECHPTDIAALRTGLRFLLVERELVDGATVEAADERAFILGHSGSFHEKTDADASANLRALHGGLRDARFSNVPCDLRDELSLAVERLLVA